MIPLFPFSIHTDAHILTYMYRIIGKFGIGEKVSLGRSTIHTSSFQEAKTHIGSQQRLAIAKNPGMSFEIIPVVHPTSDLNRSSVFIRNTLTGQRQLIGSVPEGFQRKCNELGVRTSRLENIFLTGTLDWGSISGLPGLILTVSDQGLKRLGVYHSTKHVLQYLISCWRFFVFRFGLDLDVEKPKNGPLETGGFVISPVSIKPENGSETKDISSSLKRKLDILVKQIFPIQNNPNVSNKTVTNVSLPRTITNNKICTSWVMNGIPKRGKFQVKKARELGCQIKHFKALCNFQPVNLDDGTVVTPDQVLEPTRSFEPILFLEVPSEEYLANTFKHDWSQVLKSVHADHFGAVYHFIGSSIDRPLSRPDYKEFITSFGDKTLQFISHKQYTPDLINYETSYETSLKWKCFLPRWFPLFRWCNKPELEIPEELKSTNKIFPMISGQKVNFKAGMPVTLDEATIKGMEKDIHYYEELYDSVFGTLNMDNSEQLKKDFVSWSTPSEAEHLIRCKPDENVSLADQVEILVCGTGSAIPSKFRNVLGNMVRVPFIDTKTGDSGYRTIFLDAGENTMGTIKRLFKKDDMDMLMRELKLIYLSHLHADHHMGIAGLIKEWLKRAREDNDDNRLLYIVTPWQYEKFLEELNSIEDLGDTSRLRYLSCEQFNKCSSKILPELEQQPLEAINSDDLLSSKVKIRPFTPNDDLCEQMFKDLKLKSFNTCYAFHCEYAYSCALEFWLNNTGKSFKIAYSGDSRPRKQFAHIGHHSNLLIHESTLEDDKLLDALKKRHSTTSEAVQVAILMKARKVILTHFSQRYRSFSCSKQVYEQLKNASLLPRSELGDPRVIMALKDEREKAELRMKSKKKTEDEETTDLEINLSDPFKKYASFKTRSSIFKVPVSPEMERNSSNVQIVFAFDNMLLRYGEMDKQRHIIEQESERLEHIFQSEDKIEQKEEEEEPRDRSKKRKLQSRN